MGRGTVMEGPCSPRDEVCRTVALPAPVPGVGAVAGGMLMPRETGAPQALAEDVQTRARAAGLALDAERAAALAPICSALAEADRRLRALPMAENAAAGPPWGLTERDGER